MSPSPAEPKAEVPGEIERALADVDYAAFSLGYEQAESEEDPVNRPLKIETRDAVLDALNAARIAILERLAAAEKETLRKVLDLLKKEHDVDGEGDTPNWAMRATLYIEENMK